MADFKLEEIVLATGGILLQGASSRMVTGITIDSRKLKSGELFLALKGERFNGHSFVTEAVSSGAAAVLVMEDIDFSQLNGTPVIKVRNTLAALGAIAGFHRERFDIPVIGITGSNGKTTTKDMIAAVLAEQMTVVKTEANFNNEVGLPLTLLKISPETQVAVVEMGMRGLGQIRQLTEIARPTIGVVTNVGLTHLELLGTQENIARAKQELVESLPESGLAVLNGDDNIVRGMGTVTQARVIYYGIDGPKLNYRACRIKLIENGSQFKVATKDKDIKGEFELRIAIPGRHNILNVLAAVAVARELGLNVVQIRKGLQKPDITEKRLKIFKKNGYSIIDDTYNASPASVKAALDVLKADQSGRRKIVVLADMLELGDQAGAIHFEIGVYAGQIGVDRLFAYGDLAREYIAGINRVSSERGFYFSSKQDLINELKRYLTPGDTILVKGSRGMRMEEIVTAISNERNES